MELGHVGRVVIADDEPVVRRALRTSVESTGEFHVVAEAADGHEAVEAVRAHLPDILLLDVRMPRMNGVEATAALRAPRSGADGGSDAGADAGADSGAEAAAAAHIVVTTGFGLAPDVEQALALGADAFLAKDTPREELLAALRAVREGDAVLSPQVLRQVLDALRTPASAERRQARARLDVLPPREAEVLGMVAAGLSNREIAERLHDAEGSVKALVGRMLAESGAANRLELAMLARTAGSGAQGPPR
ncbi:MULTISPECIES: response regulator transcription factor [unclassified Streptomyces]|uniref:response regulator transcription factor n=1 Tax=unclassified Streptomyces TaxID=2593676 RepID=UPI002E285CD8|nr:MULTISPECIES: response regulator transcription factor [unclassified Streptomyces]